MADLIAQMEALLATLPKRMATEMQVGPGVLAVLRRIADRPADSYGMHQLGLLTGVRVIEGSDLHHGEWRMLDQQGEEMQRGNIRAAGHTFRSFAGGRDCLAWFGPGPDRGFCGLPPDQHETDNAPNPGDPS